MLYEVITEPKKPFELPLQNKDMRRTFAYLLNHRCIDNDVLSQFAKEKLIYESFEKSKDGVITSYSIHYTKLYDTENNGIGAMLLRMLKNRDEFSDIEVEDDVFYLKLKDEFKQDQTPAEPTLSM